MAAHLLLRETGLGDRERPPTKVNAMGRHDGVDAGQEGM